MPVPGPALAAFNSKKHKLIVDSRRPQSEVATLPSLGSSSKYICAVVTDRSDGYVYVSPIHIDVSLLMSFYFPIMFLNYFSV